MTRHTTASTLSASFPAFLVRLFDASGHSFNSLKYASLLMTSNLFTDPMPSAATPVDPTTTSASASVAAAAASSGTELDGQTQLQPERVHELKHDSSVLALAVNDEYIFAGTHDGEIVVWSLATFELVQRIQAHKRSILCLFLSSPAAAPPSKRASTFTSTSTEADAQSLLISSAGDAIISVWCPKTFQRLYEIFSTHDVGDIFSVAYSRQQETVYIGSQNTAIQWINLTDPKRRALHDSAHHPDRRYHRFFDSKAVGGTSTPRRLDERWALIPKAQAVLEVDPASCYQFAHYGYVYCMLMARGPTVHVDSDEEVLISGAGDGTIKLWRLGATPAEDDDEDDEEPGIEEIMTLGTDEGESVLSLAIDGSFLYSGKIDGIIELWDLDTKQKLRVVKAHEGDIMTLQMQWGYLWSASATGSAAVRASITHV